VLRNLLTRRLPAHRLLTQTRLIERAGVAEDAEPEIGTITVTELTHDTSTTDATSWTTASVSPAASTPVYVCVWNNRATPTLPTVTGAGITWVQEETLVFDTTRRVTVFRGLNASPSAGALTIDFGGLSQTACAWSVVQCAGADTSGSDAAGATLQSEALGYNTADVSTVGPTLAALGHANNVHLAWGCAAAAAGTTMDADFSGLSAGPVVTTPTVAPCSGYATGQTNCTITHASVAGRAVVSIEVKAGTV
jgi:hypothetical protein